MMVAMVMVEEVVSKVYTCLLYNHVISPGGVSTAPVVSTSDHTSSTVEQRGKVIGTLHHITHYTRYHITRCQHYCSI